MSNNSTMEFVDVTYYIVILYIPIIVEPRVIYFDTPDGVQSLE